MSEPYVSIIIPHFNGREILSNCLGCIEKTTYQNKEVILVDNASTDNSAFDAEKEFPWLKVIHNQENVGYAGGCNIGFEASKGELVLFLNNDTEFAPDWLDALRDAFSKDKNIAACQPKLLALKNPDTFDYSGAAGGLIDVFGYPFAKGRIFFELEPDNEQYDVSSDIFWASGTAFIVRRKAMQEVGLFDEDFFAHMEEIDLNWRLHLAGYRVVSVPKSVVYHNSASTLKANSFKKQFLNHRNNLYMLLKNYQLFTLLWIFPARLLLELVTILFALLRFDFTRVYAVCAALGSLVLKIPIIVEKHNRVLRIRKCRDAEIFAKMYRGSIVLDYFIRGKKTVNELKLGQ